MLTLPSVKYTYIYSITHAGTAVKCLRNIITIPRAHGKMKKLRPPTRSAPRQKKEHRTCFGVPCMELIAGFVRSGVRRDGTAIVRRKARSRHVISAIPLSRQKKEHQTRFGVPYMELIAGFVRSGVCRDGIAIVRRTARSRHVISAIPLSRQKRNTELVSVFRSWS